MNSSRWLFSSKLSSAGVRIGILVGIVLLVISSVVGWSIVFHSYSGKSEISQQQGDPNILSSSDPLPEQITKLKKINDILYANVKETDEWVARRDQLVKALASQLPTDIVVGEVADLASASKNEDEARLYLRDLGRIFKVEKNPLILTSEEVKIRDIGGKIRQKEVLISIK
ncbi:MAG: hypothetical protein Q7R99_01640 [bacterium]|nr:hypothetical protein [bacterium]